MKRTRVIISSDIHYVENDWYGVSPDQHLENFARDLENEYKNDPYDALLLLGDYSLDHWAWNTKGSYLTKGVSNTKGFVDLCMNRIAPNGVEVRMVAGNHEQYGDELWHELTGYKRRDHLVLGDILFVLTDSFGGDLDPAEHSDGTFIGSDAAEIKALMDEYPDKKVILCSHWFDMPNESEEFKSLLKNEDRILCLFCGHNHISRVASTGEDCGNKPILYTGNYSYSGEKNPVRCLAGYRELIITDEGISSKYIVPSNRYVISYVALTTERSAQDPFELKF